MINKVLVFYFIPLFTKLLSFSLNINTNTNSFKQRNLVLIDPDPDDPYGVASQIEGYLENNFGDLIQGHALYSPTFAKELLETYDLTNDEINEIKESEYKMNGMRTGYDDICGVLCVSDTGLKTRELFSKTHTPYARGSMDFKVKCKIPQGTLDSKMWEILNTWKAHGDPWEPIGTHGSQWVLMDIHGYL